MKKLSTKSVIIILLIVIIIIPGLIFLVSSFSKNNKTVNLQDVSNWHTYTSVNEGFSFKYPNSWEFIELSEGDRENIILDAGNNFRLHFGSGDYYASGGCDDCIVYDVEEIQVGDKILYIISNHGVAGTVLYLSDTPAKIGENLLDWAIATNESNTKAYGFTAAFYDPESPSKINGYSYSINITDPIDFEQKQEFQIAKEILRSIK